MNYQCCFLGNSSTVRQSLNLINQNTQGIVYITKDDALVGAITDGNIRRHLLAGGSLDDSVQDVYNPFPKYIIAGQTSDYESFMRANDITSVPVVDKDMHILSIHFLRDGFVARNCLVDVPIIVMAGGKGTRLAPYTNVLPKPLIPITDKTILELIMQQFNSYGCNDFNLIVNYKKELIKAFLAAAELDYNIEYTDEVEYSGTAGGLRLLSGRYKDTVIVSNCDTLVDVELFDLLATHKKSGNIVTMVCARKKLTVPYGVVETNESGALISLTEKPEYNITTNVGLYAIEPEFIEKIPPNTFIHITDVIQKCLDDGEKVGVYSVNENAWLDMGQPEEMENMRKRLEALSISKKGIQE